MSLVTLRVLDGSDRGRVYENVVTPLTIGREEGNSIQLNDERVSRFHVKIQDDDKKLVLTDLESTNGTTVNGETVRLCILRHGDVITLGRTVLLLGSREDIARRLARLRKTDLSDGVTLEVDELDQDAPSILLDFELNWSEDPDAQAMLHTLLPPDLPEGLSPGQTAQLSEFLQYLHLRFRGLTQSVRTSGKSGRITLDQRQWQNLLDLESRIAGYLRSIGEPE